ncbi:DUF2600 family protein [Conexibacter stalactiti]|uniref:DUF2600 family protein n=1 Tax=Conexibacter stalactiti TaxID=1940611 RepID=A0ABU4HK92_9ACTN|nr:DUF2600 family protein [Conexibacter stalactiti]MDW5592970.1 DUF2600 family protein [Conexibacter stalactiti]MEC5033611.1 DUF2600 family protein [Conexibacter stalactiti]
MSQHRRRADIAATAAMLTALTRYAVAIVPSARAEIARWRTRASAIPEPAARRLALETLDAEHLNAEAAAVFSLLAPRRARGAVVRLLVPWQIMYDYLDTITEQPAHDPLNRSRRLHRALAAAIEPASRRSSDDFDAGDGHYLLSLVDTCRQRFWQLPAASAIAPSAAIEARRCAEAQSQTHAAMLTGRMTELRDWAAHDRAEHKLDWWESAAAGISSLGVHALLAAAADRATGTADARAIAQSYAFVCALSTMLDSLVDVDADSHTGNFSYFSAYPDATSAATGMRKLAARSVQSAERLHRGPSHRIIVSGLAAFYLSLPSAHATPTTAAGTEAVLDALRPAVKPALALLRLRRAQAESDGTGAHG